MALFFAFVFVRLLRFVGCDSVALLVAEVARDGDGGVWWNRSIERGFVVVVLIWVLLRAEEVCGRGGWNLAFVSWNGF